MSVLTLGGKPINWAKPPKPTARVMWSQKTTGGKTITGSLRTIAHLDRLNYLSIKKFGVGIQVFQGPYNTTVAASAGTHDYDACLDVYIPGVSWSTQRSFFRANGAAAFDRTKPTFSTEHIHYFTLPPREGVDVSDDYKSGGFKVGYFVDGGWSTRGARVTSSQIADYYAKPPRNALANHAIDNTWHPDDIEATIFDLDAYIARQVKATKPEVGTLRLMTANIGSVARPSALAPVLKARKPHMAFITEAYFARTYLKSIEGYRLYQYTSREFGEEGPDVAVLVRRGVKVSRRRALEMAKVWTAPSGRKRQPRVYPSLNVKVGKFWWRALALHFPTKGNPVAQQESEQATNKWLAQGTRPSAAAGDTNQAFAEVKDWAKAGTAQGTKVDHALFTKCKHQSTTRLKQPEGMHGWVIYKFTTEKKG